MPPATGTRLRIVRCTDGDRPCTSASRVAACQTVLRLSVGTSSGLPSAASTETAKVPAGDATTSS